MRFSHFLLDEIGENFDYMARERRPVVAPAPDCHRTDAKEPCRGAIAAENSPRRRLASRGLIDPDG